MSLMASAIFHALTLTLSKFMENTVLALSIAKKDLMLTRPIEFAIHIMVR